MPGMMLLMALLLLCASVLANTDNGTNSNKGRCRDYRRPNPVCVYCADETSNITLGSEEEKSLKRLLEELPSKTSPTGFAVSSGKAGVHGRAMCRGDVDPAKCEDCIKNASREILKECGRSEAILWNELCQVQYSFTRIIAEAPSAKYPSRNFKEKNVSGDVKRFQKLRPCLMNDLASKAVSNAPRFATGEASFLGKKINGLAQCVRDIEPSDCRTCFKQVLTELESCCSFKEGGAVLDQSCNVRFELDDQFYEGQSSEVKCTAGNKSTTIIIAVATCVPTLVAAGLITFGFVYCRRNRKRRGPDLSNLLFMDLPTIRAATDNFSDENKLGQGGFGAVYKGVLSNGKEVAVKRLSRKSWQGFEEFKNEIKVIAKLQHRNLVRLLGWGMEADEKILIYELMSNRSLDLYIFDSEMRRQLDWKACYSITKGIARGLLYLHEDSRLKIIHRDLKPSNVLLDGDMLAKLSDFGMARIFGGDQTTYLTHKPVGTFGYMSPEYAMMGRYSVKSDVFSFGVLVLEIISGKRNSVVHSTERGSSLLAYAWNLWKNDMVVELVETSLRESCSMSEVKKCVHISLLCVQEDPDERPTMSSVVALLEAESTTTALPEPKQPAAPKGREVQVDQASTSTVSMNVVTFSNILPR